MKAVLALEDHFAVSLGKGQIPELQSLFDRCADYVEAVSGEPPISSEAEEALAPLPLGENVEKVGLGIYDRQTALVGFVDIIRNHPIQKDWWLRLLMLDPVVRHQGLGSRIYHACADWIGQEAGRAVWIGVVDDNQGAERFWRRLGFIHVRRDPFMSESGAARTLSVLRHDLGTGLTPRTSEAGAARTSSRLAIPL